MELTDLEKMVVYACRVLDDVACYCPAEYDPKFKTDSDFWCANFCTDNYRQCWCRYLEWRANEKDSNPVQA